MSISKARGYFAKSSFAPNCFGLTKIEAITGEHSRLARSISDKCPRWSAPIVGTSPTMRLSARACRASSFIHGIVWIVSKVWLCPPAVAGRLSLARSWNSAHRLRARRGGALAVEVHQVCSDGLCAKLPQQRGHLSAVIRPVIDQMLHRFPKRIPVNAELQRLVINNAIQIRLRQPPNETKQARFVFVPALPQARNILELSRVGK